MFFFGTETDRGGKRRSILSTGKALHITIAPKEKEGPSSHPGRTSFLSSAQGRGGEGVSSPHTKGEFPIIGGRGGGELQAKKREIRSVISGGKSLFSKKKKGDPNKQSRPGLALFPTKKKVFCQSSVDEKKGIHPYGKHEES